MSDPIGTYTFLPWVRQGLANSIPAGPAGLRPKVVVALELQATTRAGGSAVAPVQREVELYGPGDVVGIDAAQISRVEPAHWVTNFEPNYLAAIEFYDEDFPWRYTPAAPSGRRLLPWLALVVLEEGAEFTEAGIGAGKPLACIDVTAPFAAVFPDAAEGWAWAHAHFNTEFSSSVVEADAAKVAQAAQQVIDAAPDTACSRLLCPRKLKPKTGYHAFLLPAFESGRLAGLGRDPKSLFADAANGLTATSSAWGSYATPANRPEPARFPYYHRWYFRTAEHGDFEALVRLLRPRAVDSRVGHRDIDVTRPSPNLGGIDAPALSGVLRLGGALRAPLRTLGTAERAEFEKYEGWATPYPRPFQTRLAAFLNLADGYQRSGAAANGDPALPPAVRTDPDPLLAPPIYGRWHALTERLLTEGDGSDLPNRTNWVHDLNLDPRWRTAAGFGTKVVQTGQEIYMEAAWDQIGDVLEANRRIRQAQLAAAAGRRLHRTHVAGAAKVSPATVLLKTAPLSARVVSQGLTVRQRVLESPMSTAMTSSAMRRLLRPGGKVAERLGLSGNAKVAELVRRANDGEVRAAPAKVPPERILTPGRLADAVEPRTPVERFWARVGRWIQDRPWLALLLLLALLVLLILLIGSGWTVIAAAAAAVGLAWAAWRRARGAARAQTAADLLREESFTPEAVDRLPGSGGFTLSPHVDPRAEPPPGDEPAGSDSPDAVRFKTALRDQYRLLVASGALGAVSPSVPLDLAAAATDTVAAIRPEVTVPRWTLSGLSIPPRIREQVGARFMEVMAYPEFDTPMYAPLAAADTDAFVPNLHLVEPDSVTLLETNQPFIEAYMVGLNHEFARELLWREYPTDQRGSYFRQFWDVRRKIAAAAAADREAAREALKDIRPLHLWPGDADLGENDNREAGAAAEDELVLVVRGELFKKYPNTVVSAQPAKWQLTGGRPDKTKERELDESRPRLSPLYEARVAPDLYFFGFDLTAVKARGDDAVDDRPGWFFRLEEVAGDARFGFDVSRDPGSQVNVWNDLAWSDVVPALADGKHIRVADIPPRALVEPVGDAAEKHPQWEADRHVPLGAAVSAAELAYIALQTPVIMAIHASELLPDDGGAHA